MSRIRGKKKLPEPHSRADELLLELVSIHHRTLTPSKMHDPTQREWQYCDCRICARVWEYFENQRALDEDRKADGEDLKEPGESGCAPGPRVLYSDVAPRVVQPQPPPEAVAGSSKSPGPDPSLDQALAQAVAGRLDAEMGQMGWEYTLQYHGDLIEDLIDLVRGGSPAETEKSRKDWFPSFLRVQQHTDRQRDALLIQICRAFDVPVWLVDGSPAPHHNQD